MTSEVRLSALRSDDPLGFLAALGVLRIVDRQCRGTKLAWSAVGGPALLTATGCQSVDDMVKVLASFVAELSGPPGPSQRDGRAPFPDRALFDMGARDLFSAVGSGGQDPSNLTLGELLDLRRAALDEALGANDARSEWMSALYGPGEVDSSQPLTLTYRKYTGQTWLNRSLNLLQARLSGHDEVLREALAGWRRVDGVNGAQLDHRAVADSGLRPDGQPMNRAVPGATWLALMSIPMLPAVGPPPSTRTTGWQRVGRDDALVWPVWRQPIGVAAVMALIAHPGLRLDEHRGVDSKAVRALGLDGVVVSRRQRIGKSSGPLGPAEVVWSR